MERISSISK